MKVGDKVWCEDFGMELTVLEIGIPQLGVRVYYKPWNVDFWLPASVLHSMNPEEFENEEVA